MPKKVIATVIPISAPNSAATELELGEISIHKSRILGPNANGMSRRYYCFQYKTGHHLRKEGPIVEGNTQEEVLKKLAKNNSGFEFRLEGEYDAAWETAILQDPKCW